MAEGLSKDYLDAQLVAERRQTEEAIKRLDQALVAADKAVSAALTSADKLSEKHNELIRKGENKEAEFASKEEVDRLRDEVSALGKAQSRIAGASVLGSVVLAIIINLMLRLAGVGS